MEPPGPSAGPASAEPEASSAPAVTPAPTAAVADAPAAVPPAGAAVAATGSTSPLTSISKSDLKTFRTWFDYADTDGDGRLTALDAVPFFRRSGLSSEELKGVWACADAGKRGFLSFNDFIIAMQLIWQLQRGAMGLTAGEGSIVPHMEGLEAAMKGEAAEGADSSKAGAAASAVSMPRQGSTGWFAPREPPNPAAVTSVVDGLKALYRAKLKPLETTYRFHDFVSPMLRDSDFDAKPMVMLLGQYSTGKTTFIKHLLGQPYPGAHIGPEPTTDRFVVVMNGPDQRTIPGNTVAVQADMPFAGLTKFGSTFLEKLEVSQMRHPLLEQFSLVDTPGVLSGEKQRTMRSYDFTGVTEWFATKCDLILLLFDPHKLDVSDEFKRVIASLHGNFDKIRIVLNKADSIDTQQLMRVYGALMWSLGKVINTPEVMRVYIGSFNDWRRSQDQAAAEADSNGEVGRGRAGAAALLGRELFEREENDLLIDLVDIPRKSCDRKINEFVKRARSARVNAFVISHLRAQMPMFGRPRAQQRLIETLKDEFAKIEREHHVPAGDFPRVELMQQALAGYSFDTFERLKPKLIEDVDRMLAYDVPELLKRFRNPYG